MKYPQNLSALKTVSCLPEEGVGDGTEKQNDIKIRLTTKPQHSEM